MTLFVTHSACLEHLTPPGHPERPERLRAIEQVLEHEKFMFLLREQCPKAGFRNHRSVPSVGIYRTDSPGGAADRAGPARR
jgi:acetoin utilization deacetylase AcuC-like enzyme